MTSALSKTAVCLRGQTICQLLVAIGLPRAEVYVAPWSDCASLRRQRTRRNKTASFWARNEYDLDLWAQRAHSAYRELAVRVHPDLGGNPEDAIALNAIWERIKHLFRQKGVTI